MANIDKAFDVELLSLNDSMLIAAGTSDPSSGGFEAPRGSLYLQQLPSGGELWTKYGDLDTDWRRFTDNFVRVSSNDTTSGYLLNKLSAGTNITLTETNDGGNESITINGIGSGALSDDLSAVTAGLAANIAINTTFTNVQWPQTFLENDTTTIEHDNTNTERFLIKETGLYLIGYSISFDADPGEETIAGRVLIDDLTLVPGSYREASEDDEVNDLSNFIAAELTAGTYITFQSQANGTGNTLHSSSTFTVVRARASTGAPGFGMYAWARTSGNGTIQKARGLSVSRPSVGTYNYTFTQPIVNNEPYSLSHSLIFPTVDTDTNLFISNTTNTGFTVYTGVGDNGTTPDVLADVEHCINVIGPEGPAGITSSYQSWLNVGNVGTEQSFIDSLEGPEGQPGVVGPVGSGSNVRIENDGVAIPNTPHDTLNFKNVTVTDAGAGTADIEAVFGSYYNYGESDTVTTTTSDVFLEKTSITTGSLPAGNYRIGWSYQWNHDNAGNDFEARVRLDGTTDIMLHKQEPKDSAGAFSTTGTSQQYQNSGFKHISLSGVHNIVLDFRTDSNGDESSMWNARIELWRVS